MIKYQKKKGLALYRLENHPRARNKLQRQEFMMKKMRYQRDELSKTRDSITQLLFFLTCNLKGTGLIFCPFFSSRIFSIFCCNFVYQDFAVQTTNSIFAITFYFNYMLLPLFFHTCFNSCSLR